MEIHEKIKVLIVAKCIVNVDMEHWQTAGSLVLIVAKCIVNAFSNASIVSPTKVLIVAKCIVNSIFLKDFQHFC